MAEALTIPRLEDYDVSDRTGFNLENPQVTLPDEFKPWIEIKENLVQLISDKKFRDKVNEMPLLDHTLLKTHHEQRLAHMVLTFIGTSYVWQDGDTGVAKSVPEQLAIPWCALSDLVGLPPVITLSTVALSNYRLIDDQGPLNIENMTTICDLPGEDSTKQFFLHATQIELDSLPGLNAILEAMHGVVKQDVELVIRSLNAMTQSLKTVMKSMKRLQKTVDPGVFFNVLRPFLAGWGGEDTPLPDGLIYEGATPRQRKLKGGSQAQSSSIQCFDAALGLTHPEKEQKYLDEVRDYMPKLHAKLIHDLWSGPSIKDFVASSQDSELRKAYVTCVTRLNTLRSLHIALARSYIVMQVRRNKGLTDHESLDNRGTGGNPDFMVFLENIRGTTSAESLNGIAMQ